ncbi:GNAT family N-acetyltransferase [Ectobacillus funiculus]
MKKRIQLTPDSFFVAEKKDGVIVGFVNGPVIETAFITDDLFGNVKENPASGGHQSVFRISSVPAFFKKNEVWHQRYLHILKNARENNRETITLTCKENLIRFYENYGYRNLGVSSSEHGRVIWYNMSKKSCSECFYRL